MTVPTLARHGHSVGVPPGWDARIYRNRTGEPGAVARPILHACDIPLPAVRGDYGSGVVERLGPSNVFVAVVEFDPADAGTGLFAGPRPEALLPEYFSPGRLQRGIPGQAGAQLFFSQHRRTFCVYVVIGSYRDRLTLAPKANALFAAWQPQ